MAFAYGVGSTAKWDSSHSRLDLKFYHPGQQREFVDKVFGKMVSIGQEVKHDEVPPHNTHCAALKEKYSAVFEKSPQGLA